MKLNTILIFLLVGIAACGTKTQSPPSPMQAWLTTADKSKLLAWGEDLQFTQGEGSGSIIEIDSATTYQTMDGFGY
ncbi:MAG: hypothetical protein ABL895_20745, partial [Cyclobacteriaceae bacterium]